MDEYFISPVVITVKSDNSIKLALESKDLNDAIYKNIYQMQSIDHRMDTISKKHKRTQKHNRNTILVKNRLKVRF